MDIKIFLISLNAIHQTKCTRGEKRKGVCMEKEGWQKDFTFG